MVQILLLSIFRTIFILKNWSSVPIKQYLLIPTSSEPLEATILIIDLPMVDWLVHEHKSNHTVLFPLVTGLFHSENISGFIHVISRARISFPFRLNSLLYIQHTSPCCLVILNYPAPSMGGHTSLKRSTFGCTPRCGIAVSFLEELPSMAAPFELPNMNA